MNAPEKKFVATVERYYAEHGRHQLPWRKTKNPYRILVSEIMLQQTQVERVIPKYQAFLKLFPTVQTLAAAPLGEVLVAWQGLGYNRRAKLLWQCAGVVARDLGGKWPRDYEGLIALPGVGPYTASAVLAFAYNVATPLIETNVRTVYLHHFFSGQTDVSDRDVLQVVTRTLNPTNPRAWYAALMDYGSYLKSIHPNPSRQSKHHTKQSKFAGSDRQLRGLLIRTVATGRTKRELTVLAAASSFTSEQLTAQLSQLQREGLIVYTNRTYGLPI